MWNPLLVGAHGGMCDSQDKMRYLRGIGAELGQWAGRAGSRRGCRGDHKTLCACSVARRSDPTPAPGDYDSRVAPSGKAFTIGKRTHAKDGKDELPGPGEYHSGERMRQSSTYRSFGDNPFRVPEATECAEAPAQAQTRAAASRARSAHADVPKRDTPAWTMQGRPKERRKCKGKRRSASPGPGDYAADVLMGSHGGPAFSMAGRGSSAPRYEPDHRPVSYVGPDAGPSGPSFTMRAKPPLPRPPKVSTPSPSVASFGALCGRIVLRCDSVEATSGRCRQGRSAVSGH